MTGLLVSLSGESLWRHLLNAAERDSVLFVAGAFVVIALLLLKLAPVKWGGIASASRFFAISLGLLFVAALLEFGELKHAGNAFHAAGLMIGAVGVLNLGSIFVFDVLLGRLQPPGIVRDLIVAFAYLVAGLWLVSRQGVTLTGIVTTSAVITGIIAFSLQDSLANIMGGLALQLDETVNVGDWIKVDQTIGKVTAIRWRYTAVETRNWETVLIPNAMMIRSQVTVIGQRAGQPVQVRRWIFFNVDFRVPPPKVIDVVTDALLAEPMPAVAADPPPNCILFDFKESYGQYAARYWLTDLPKDDPTDSMVRSRIYYALMRAGIPLSVPAYTTFLEEHSQEHKLRGEEREMQRRLRALDGSELFRSLTAEERNELAGHMLYAPFTKGEPLTRQGAEAHWLYILTQGSAEVLVAAEGGPRARVATLRAGDIMGEMSLLTGEKRSATVVALEDTECYRLDREALHDILHRRPEIAEYLSQVSANRRVELQATRETLDAETRNRIVEAHKRSIFADICRIFGLRGKSQAV